MLSSSSTIRLIFQYQQTTSRNTRKITITIAKAIKSATNGLLTFIASPIGLDGLSLIDTGRWQITVANSHRRAHSDSPSCTISWRHELPPQEFIRRCSSYPPSASIPGCVLTISDCARSANPPKSRCWPPCASCWPQFTVSPDIAGHSRWHLFFRPWRAARSPLALSQS